MHAANQAFRWMPGNAGASLVVLLLGHVPCSSPTCSASQVGGAVASTLSQLWDKAGEAPQARPGVSPLPSHSGHPRAAGGGLAGVRGWPQHRGSPWHSKSISIHPLPPPLLLSCLPCAVALTLVLPRPCPQSLAHSVCKEGNGRLPN